MRVLSVLFPALLAAAEADPWALRPLNRFPESSSIDGFLKMKAPPADRRSLIRRAAFDLTGLPPAPDEVDAFVNDKAPRAWERLVDRLLASPRYGERWGRHWLDVVRYADSSGYSNDFERPNAWRYRDYVIRSFNNDKPYDRFIREQIAGDEIFPGDPEAWIATGFLRAGPWEHTGMSVEAVTRQMFLDDVTHATAATFLALTLGCARCHDHKFDPIPTRDFYRMQAIFATTEFARPSLPFLDSENTAAMESGAARMNEIVRRTQENMKGFGPEQKKIAEDKFEEYKLYQKHMQLYRESLDRYQPKAFVVSSGPLDGVTDGGPNLRYPKRDNYKPAEVHILRGGNLQSPGEQVAPGLLSAVERYSGFQFPAPPQTVSGRRAALANWIADPRNPLTPRVMVNRLWQYHFGRGIARDSNNFGKMGGKPAQPELLDYLAGRLIDNGWSVKSMHRLIMNSSAYRSAAFEPRRIEAESLRDSLLAVAGELSLDAGGPGTFPQINEDLARQPRHAMGSLQPAYHPSPQKRLRNRRTIYSFQQRTLIDPLIEVFNGPSLDLSCERRDTSTAPTQAFTLFNGQFSQDMALAMAARLEREGATLPARVDRAFRLAYGRTPSKQELQHSLAHIEKMTAWHKATPPPPKPGKKPVVHEIMSELTGESVRFAQQEDPAVFEENLHPSEVGPATRALADFALALINSNEFVYVY